MKAVLAAALVVASCLCACASGFDDAPLGRKLPLFPKSNPPSRNLLHVDLLKAPEEQRFALTVLQGLVNREQPRIYLSQDPAWHTPDLLPVWMDRLKKRGFVFEEIADPMSLIPRFQEVVKGAVIYESNLKRPGSLHKLNSITLFCALHNGIPLTEEMNARLHLPVLLDVRGKYNTAAEAYEWAYKELWPKANHHLMANTCPTHLALRDYLVENKVMPFWISQEADKQAEEICLRMLDEMAPNSPVMGCFGGFGEIPAGRVDEADLERILSLRGKFLVVSDGCSNLSVHSGLTYENLRKTSPPVRVKLDPGKVYICFNFTDGDNLQYLQLAFDSTQWWRDPNRGKIPLSWSISPNLAELLPDVLEYFQSTQTPQDEFVAPTSGLGIAVPSLYGKEWYANHEEVYDEFIGLTWNAMARTGMTCIHLGDTSNVPWSRADFDRWALKIPKLEGILGDYGFVNWVDRADAASMLSNQVPLARALVTSPSQQGMKPASWAAQIRKFVPAERPAFVHVNVINWLGSPTAVLQVAQELGPEYVPVLPSQLFDLMRQNQKKSSAHALSSASSRAPKSSGDGADSKSTGP